MWQMAGQQSFGVRNARQRFVAVVLAKEMTKIKYKHTHTHVEKNVLTEWIKGDHDSLNYKLTLQTFYGSPKTVWELS